MPRGYYLAQGVIPLGYSSSDDDEGTCQLPNGHLVCGPHGLVVCHKCYTDYSLANDDLDDDDDEDEDEEEDEEVEIEEEVEEEESDKPPEHVSRCLNSRRKMVRGTGKVFPSKFVPSNSNERPLEEFPNRYRYWDVYRRTHFKDNTKVLFMTDGACLNNGESNPRAGWAFVQGESLEFELDVVSGRLENRGPWGDQGSQTSNRAELRAVLAALRFRYWYGEGFKTVVFATDSSYVVDGATQWARGWVSNNWRTKGRKGSGGADVKNKDLWEMLLGECEMAHEHGLAIQFWKIPREWNTLADEGAKKAAAEKDASDHWGDMMGVPFKLGQPKV